MKRAIEAIEDAYDGTDFLDNELENLVVVDVQTAEYAKEHRPAAGYGTLKELNNNAVESPKIKDFTVSLNVTSVNFEEDVTVDEGDTAYLKHDDDSRGIEIKLTNNQADAVDYHWRWVLLDDGTIEEDEDSAGTPSTVFGGESITLDTAKLELDAGQYELRVDIFEDDDGDRSDRVARVWFDIYSDKVALQNYVWCEVTGAGERYEVFETFATVSAA